MVLVYDRQGVLVADPGRADALFSNFAYRRVKLTYVQGYRVSTVWLGFAHDFDSKRRPLIFETMVFKGEGLHELYCDRYASEEEALAGHAAAVREYGQQPHAKQCTGLVSREGEGW